MAENSSWQNIIIAIHGVGDAPRGQIAKDITECLDVNESTEDKLIKNKSEFVRIRSTDKKWEIIEVNWSDLQKPKKNYFSVLRHILLVYISLLAVGEDKLKSLKIKRILNPAFYLRILLESFYPGIVMLSILVMAGTSMTQPYERAILMATLTAILSWFTFKVSKYSNFFKINWIWVIAMITAAVLLVVDRDAYYSSLTLITSKSVAYLHVLIMLFLAILSLYFLVNIITNFLNKKTTLKKIVTHFALFYIPYILMNFSGTVITLLAVLPFAGVEGNCYNDWWTINKQHIYFDLAYIELLTTILFCAIGLIPILITLVYYSKSDSELSFVRNNSGINNKGALVQKGLYIFLIMVPILLLSFLVYNVYYTNTHPEKVIEHSIIQVYKISILRVVPYLSLSIGVFAVILNVIGDILFFIHPNTGSKISIKKKSIKRFNNALNYSKNKNTNVIVVAHSWGSIVAFEALKNANAKIKLITIGSPLQTLYSDFLDCKLSELNIVKWLNGYRYGDYIAGPITQTSPKLENRLIENGGHTGYWNSIELKKLIKEQMQ